MFAVHLNFYLFVSLAIAISSWISVDGAATASLVKAWKYWNIQTSYLDSLITLAGLFSFSLCVFLSLKPYFTNTSCSIGLYASSGQALFSLPIWIEEETFSISFSVLFFRVLY